MNDNCFNFSIELLSHVLVHMSSLVVTDKLFVDTVYRLMSLVASAPTSIDSTVDERRRNVLLNIIGYCLVQRLGKPESLAYVVAFVQTQSNQQLTNCDIETNDFRTMFSLLYGSHGTAATTPHPILQLLLNVYLAPHLGCIQHLDSLKATDLSNLDPSAIFASHLNLRNHCITCFPLTSAVLEPYLFPTDIDEQQVQQQQKRRMIPDIHTLTRRPFAILVRSLLPDATGDEPPKRKKSKSNCSRLDGFSCDLVSEILSYLSFKRVCRMALVSTRFLKASKALALWETLYLQKFPDVLWSIGPDAVKEQEMVEPGECLHCCRVTQRQRPSSTTSANGNKYCNNPMLQHQWPVLFRDKAIAARKVRLAASNRRPQKGNYKSRVCPYLGCVFVLRSESKEVVSVWYYCRITDHKS